MTAVSIGPPNSGTPLLCMICAHEKPWGIFDSKTGAAVCIECRDKARGNWQQAVPGGEVERLRESALACLKRIVCTEPPDDGVVLLSNDSPCHPDPVTGVATYDHAHFSPLGDALIELWEILVRRGHERR